MRKVITAFLLAALTSCGTSKEICTNRHMYTNNDGQSTELRHGTYFRIKSNKVQEYCFDGSEWHNGKDFQVNGDTIYYVLPNVVSKFYNSKE